MSKSEGSITRLIEKLQGRDPNAIEEIWKRYRMRIHSAARPTIAGLSPGAGDEEDVGQSAFRDFCEAAGDGRLPNMNDRDALWRLLFAFTRRKAVDHVRRETRSRRGGGDAQMRNDQALQQVPGTHATPVEMLQLQETLDALFERLDASDDANLRTIALLRLEGFTNQEIAERLVCTVRTIQRKLHILERLWFDEAE